MAENTTMRDELAKDRTHMANERTLLSYMRTALGIVAFAFFAFKFLPTVVGFPLGGVAIVLGIIVCLYGLKSYQSMKSKINGDEHIAVTVDSRDEEVFVERGPILEIPGLARR